MKHAKVYTNGEFQFITRTELEELGVLGGIIMPFRIVEVNGAFYELQGYSKTADAYWVQQIKIPTLDQIKEGLEAFDA